MTQVWKQYAFNSRRYVNQISHLSNILLCSKMLFNLLSRYFKFPPNVGKFTSLFFFKVKVGRAVVLVDRTRFKLAR